MIVKRVTTEVWLAAEWRAQMDDAVMDYLARSHEELTLEEEWSIISTAILEANGMMMMVGLNHAENQLLGYCIGHAVSGTKVTGNVGVIWQVYMKPDTGVKLQDLFERGWAILSEWAKAYDVKRFQITTRHLGLGFEKYLGKMGFRPYAKVLIREN